MNRGRRFRAEAHYYWYLMPLITGAKRVLNRDDERDLFNLANNFGIRHHKPGQKTDYDQAIWHSWMFHHYLATIHACVRVIEKAKTSPAHHGGAAT